MKFEHVIWDWNGTLLNDIHITIRCMNTILEEQGLAEMDKVMYLDKFGFPVREYYEKIGLDFAKTPFEELSLKFIDHYGKTCRESTLHDNVEKVLKDLSDVGITQSVLSASEENVLRDIVHHFGIEGFFTALVGLDNHHAKSKVERGLQWLEKNHIDIAKTVMVGDTLHDVKVAKALGCHCILVSHGHQSYERLKSSGVTIVRNLLEAEEYILMTYQR